MGKVKNSIVEHQYPLLLVENVKNKSKTRSKVNNSPKNLHRSTSCLIMPRSDQPRGSFFTSTAKSDWQELRRLKRHVNRTILRYSWFLHRVSCTKSLSHEYSNVCVPHPVCELRHTHISPFAWIPMTFRYKILLLQNLFLSARFGVGFSIASRFPHSLCACTHRVK